MAAASAVRAAGRRSRRLFDIFVAEIPWTVSSKELKEYFSQFGSVQRCQLPFNRDTGFHRRYCWIKFSTPEEVQNVLQKDSHILEGSKVAVLCRRVSLCIHTARVVNCCVTTPSSCTPNIKNPFA
ncbi:SRA stem-loop-interacting RNA-binding protein, mitochondrial isoform X1 [Pyrgilauda ruficollis]|uniref:SRA stem-loop-interacting RNA-binding protein, mitochondrial isoform X1 n=1 Tax=Pyrgilauda ruficollis TaxID=221976 RepID=UPI001B8718BF|nr:SRA stem-loop-interacting RNA-binding protein, mitochondrial isoform X1 [Pyrgilauda ruficollis]